MKYVALILLLYAGTARADCWDRAGSMFHIDPALLYAIAEQESSLNPAAIGRNRDGSQDLGLMQINSRHLPRLQKLGINQPKLLQDPCLSVIVGASILSDMMKRYGYTWEAVGAYNAGTAPNRHELRMRYAHRVWQRYQRLIAPADS
ncbi:type III secretion system invasion protein IagB [Chromobacterium amazonense]|uniref:Type III secretion system invasion protein IagB n=1 Tax=Chromobacterium amazonense TaxID=1382803 RepID=A0ABU8UYW1_9NEIS|nr:type III secretion system invasion protein IagB [Chromobacterium amazonense]MBM2885056.1 type III secretion system invasion protein IagB [Chromobacterium amazonense]MDE1715606.1 type III secretion system invasion protein IagB [Chromobacterium amazonense]MDQ4541324.1 type III secretion system invasion protein IagB [Chromobacterium amazonense]